MTPPEAGTWPGKILSKQKSNSKQMKIVLQWEVLVSKERDYITHPICKFQISVEKETFQAAR